MRQLILFLALFSFSSFALDSGIRVPGKFEYETVAASQTDQALGTTGATGDILERIVVTVTGAGTTTLSIKDGSGSAISLIPDASSMDQGIHILEMGGMVSASGAWSITTGSGISAIGVGHFTD